MKNLTSLSRWSVSLATALIVLFTIVYGIELIFLDNIQSQTVEKIFSVMNERLIKNNSEMIAHRTSMFLDTPVAASKLMAHILQQNEHISSFEIEQELHHIMTVDFSDVQSISCISFASANGGYIAFSRTEQNNQNLIKSTVAGEKGRVTFQGDNDRSATAGKDTNYNILNRPWFIKARTSNHAFWSVPAHDLSLDKGGVITWRDPVTNNAGQFIGVISVDIELKSIANWLENITKGTKNQVILLDKQGRTMASSSPATKTILAEIHNKQSASERRSNIPTVYPTQDHRLILLRGVQDSAGQLNWTLGIVTPDNPWTLLIHHYSLYSLMWGGSIVLVGMLITILVLILFTRPLNSLISKVHLLGTQDWPNAENYPFTEVNTLARALDNKSLLINKLFEKQQKMLEVDSETGLLTHSGLRKKIHHSPGRKMTALIHLTNYSVLTNLLGPEYGHRLLARLIGYLKITLPTESLLSREKVDKLLVVFPELQENEQQQWHAFLEELFFSFRETDIEQETILLTGNTAIVYESVTEERFDYIVLNAGIALDDARKKGNGALSVFNTVMQDNGIHNLRLHKQLHQGLEQNEFYLVMQPIVNLENNGVCREGECLIRWESPTLGFVPPDQFISLAEKTGLIIPLGNWIIKTACQELAQFIRRGAPVDFKLHINISPLQLAQPDFSLNLLACIKQNHLEGKNICVEITEGMILNNHHDTLQQLVTLRNSGVTVSLDDFGSGYSSLSYLHTIPFDQLKIDRQFVRDLLSSSRSEKVIASVLSLSQAFGVPLVAEGIEDDETGVKLKQMGCHLAQGYYYGRPQKFESWDISTGKIYL